MESTFEALGFNAGKAAGGDAPDYRLYDPDNPEKPVAVCLAYSWNRYLDGRDEARDAKTPDENPGARVVTVLESGEAPWAILTRGETQVVSHTLFEVIEVDSVDHLKVHDDSSTLEAGIADAGAEPSLSLQSIQQVKDRVGTAYAPSSVPDGFTIIGRKVSGDHSIQTSYANNSLRLLISQESIQGQPRVKRGYAEQVDVNGQPAYLVRGIWVEGVREDGSISPTEWDPELGLTLYFQKDSHWFTVSVLPFPETHGLNKETLLSVAESIELQP